MAFDQFERLWVIEYFGNTRRKELTHAERRRSYLRGGVSERQKRDMEENDKKHAAWRLYADRKWNITQGDRHALTDVLVLVRILKRESKKSLRVRNTKNGDTIMADIL